MRLLFSLLSALYIVGIFLLADQPFMRGLSRFNPYSLLHIPLYGILTLLLIFSIVPMKFASIKPSPSKNPGHLGIRITLAALVASVVAISDEIYQSSLPSRHGSVGDVLLDLLGIGLSTVLGFGFFNPHSLLSDKKTGRPKGS